jgi:hypothetical protein
MSKSEETTGTEETTVADRQIYLYLNNLNDNTSNESSVRRVFSVMRANFGDAENDEERPIKSINNAFTITDDGSVYIGGDITDMNSFDTNSHVSIRSPRLYYNGSDYILRLNFNYLYDTNSSQTLVDYIGSNMNTLNDTLLEIIKKEVETLNTTITDAADKAANSLPSHTHSYTIPEQNNIKITFTDDDGNQRTGTFSLGSINGTTDSASQ